MWGVLFDYLLCGLVGFLVGTRWRAHNLFVVAGGVCWGYWCAESYLERGIIMRFRIILVGLFSDVLLLVDWCCWCVVLALAYVWCFIFVVVAFVLFWILVDFGVVYVC